ncbi:choice-of-anchor D domain-containing protein [Winogradskyella alexanderae]|uniref:Choice-of-anchor D domain-containing protein n=1 Tax=Winogradskyella alexanderae TaxID=2877123 RepID=A0ABS7XR47_9FLAO|nr:choice-of-anchor D domain-containing protein [Winogradskyella alexanderae]MCA0131918.1 choice-of-anchor D domain-containing protein [Winogradskyella alexanderae]
MNLKIASSLKGNFNASKWVLSFTTLLLCTLLHGQSSDFKVQHVKDDIGNSGGINTEFSPVNSLEKAIAIPNSNRKTHAGVPGFGGTLHADDLSGARVLTNTGTLSYYRQNGSRNSEMRFHSSILEYIGPEGGPNEIIVRGRYQVSLNGSNNSATQLLNGITDANRCIPFISGILTNDGNRGADSATALAYLEDLSTLRVEKGTNSNNVTVFVTVVEFTGSNWTVLHGDSSNVSTDTGTIRLTNESDGTGSPITLESWDEAAIFTHHRGDNTINGINQAISDNWPLISPGEDNQSVDWRFHVNHDSNGTNRQFVHVLANSDLRVSRYQLNSNSGGETDFDISSSNLSNIEEALIVGASITSGNGTAYGRGWRNYDLKSTTQASHWSHRGGNNMTHEIQIIDLSDLTSDDNSTPTDYCNSFGNTQYDTGITNVTFNTINHSDGSPKDNGYEDFTLTHSTTVQLNSTRNLSVNVDTDGFYSVHVFAWIDWNQDLDFEDDGERYDLGTAIGVDDGPTNLSPLAITIPTTAVLGATRMRIAVKFGEDPSLCETNFDGEVEDYEIVVTESTPEAEINITGNGFDILDGDTTPTIIDHTDFGEVYVDSGSISRIFTIENQGNSNALNLNGTAPYISISGAHAADFSITAMPSNTIASSASTSFTLSFDPSGEGLRTAIISIASSDSDENPYNFTIQGTGIVPTYCNSIGNLAYQTSVTNVTFNTINNSDGAPKDVGYEDFTSEYATSVEIGTTHDLSVKVDTDGNYVVHAFAWIDWNQDFDFDDEGESYDLGSAVNVPDGITSLSPLAITIPEGAQIGETRMRVSAKYWSDPSSCETNFDGEVEDYTIIITSNALAEIAVSGNGYEIENGDTTPSLTDHTDFGSVNLNETKSKIFTVLNTGSVNLEITDIILSNTTDFSIVGTPSPSTLNPDESITFEVAFNTSSIGLKNSTITIENNDADEFSFQFVIQASGVQNFYDSDGDGVLDNIDIDDDNDGIADAVEEMQCNNSDIAVKTHYKFLNETFGSGERTTINTTYNAVTTYCYEDGTSSCPDLGGIDLNDGEYTVYYRAGNGNGTNDTPNGEVGSWADTHWYLGEDHTPDDTNGRMAMFNASHDSGIFYTANISGALPNVPISYSFWVINLDRTDAPDIGSRLRPDILVEFRDLENNLLASITTGEIPPTTAGNLAGDWYNFSADLTFDVSEFNVYFYNNETGGLGNDLALDDIKITQSLCDTDSDGVANIFDLDSDNDGIPDVVESGYSPVSNGSAVIDSWIDNNNNGMHDAFESLNPVDSDGDGTPDYLDLDSDNDTLFDVDESGAGNIADLFFENGDGDIDGDGVGDGEDSDAVREKDLDSDGIPEFFGDGILDVYDFHNGTTLATAYGNEGQGMEYTLFVNDSDSDGLPDYIDIYNDSDATYNISQTLYAGLDSNNDGIIDDSLDTDGDGILDLFDTADDTFGSPRHLSKKLQIHFDGRNDYIQDSPIISEWGEITLMGWIRLDTDGSGEQFLFGQNNFNLRILNSGLLQADISGTSVMYTTEIPTNRWTHVSVSYSASNEAYNIYVNGENVQSGEKSGTLNPDTSNFTMAKNPTTNSQYFKGYLDEIRLFNKALSADEIQKITYQQIGNGNNGYIRGKEIPLDIETLYWSDLVKYYSLNNFKGNITDDLKTPGVDEGSGATLYNIKGITFETAPLPFITNSGDTDIISALNDIEDGVFGSDAITYDWSIVRISHNNISYNDRQKHLGLFVDENDSSSNPIEFHVTNDSELNVSWYLKLDGFIDLEGESQLIQGDNSMLDPLSKGKLERDQQGTADTFTYNYWSSPVGSINSNTNNNDYQLNTVLMDGSNPENPMPINWITSGYNGSNSSPIGLADYWIWKFDNHLSNDYSSWQHVRSTGTMSAGEGFTMKGPGTGPINADQNYVFVGKPNNGTISLPINAGNNYMLGNPYPSALDARQFIIDNAAILAYENSSDPDPTISGTIYFWEHWGGGSHILQEYQGGYAVYNLAGGVAAPSYGTNDPDVATGGTPTKIPGRYIPVSQGFFVLGESDGNVEFRNSQRVFVKETSASSVFMKNSNPSSSQDNSELEDDRMKFRIGFNAPGTIHRQILLTIDSIASPEVDRGFDAAIYDSLTDDMYWMINEGKYTIQGYDAIEDTTVLPIGLHTSSSQIYEITIDDLENVPNDLEIYLHDKTTGNYHDLRASSFELTLDAGEYLNRFEITFTVPQTLSINDAFKEGFNLYYAMGRKKIVVLNPELIQFRELRIYDINGREVLKHETREGSYNEYSIPEVSTGVYIVKLLTENSEVSKKFIVK